MIALQRLLQHLLAEIIEIEVLLFLLGLDIFLCDGILHRRLYGADGL